MTRSKKIARILESPPRCYVCSGSWMMRAPRETQLDYSQAALRCGLPTRTRPRNLRCQSAQIQAALQWCELCGQGSSGVTWLVRWRLPAQHRALIYLAALTPSDLGVPPRCGHVGEQGSDGGRLWLRPRQRRLHAPRLRDHRGAAAARADVPPSLGDSAPAGPVADLPPGVPPAQPSWQEGGLGAGPGVDWIEVGARTRPIWQPTGSH